jgi:hypothetical protein
VRCTSGSPHDPTPSTRPNLFTDYDINVDDTAAEDDADGNDDNKNHGNCDGEEEKGKDKENSMW